MTFDIACSPIYNASGGNAKPTVKMRQIQYKLKAREAGKTRPSESWAISSSELNFNCLKLWLIASLTSAILFIFVLGQNSTARRSSSSPNDMQTYSMDLSQSQIKLILTQEGLLARMHPAHNVGVKKFSGKILYLPQDEAKVSVTLEAETGSFENIDADMSDFERKGFQDVLHNKVLESGKYPKIAFKSAAVSEVKSNGDQRSFTLSGDLTLHGTTRRITFPVNATIDKSVLRATGEAKLKQSDFGMVPFQGGFGTIKIANELKISFVIVAKPSPD